MRDLMITIFGSYLPNTDLNGEPLAGLAGVDWEYIAGVILFGITLYCVLRCIEAVIRK